MAMGKIKNWAEFQHYKDRAPPWIKLHRGFLDDFDFARLPIASKALAPMIWLLAAESKDGSVCIDPEWIAFRLRWPVDDVVAGLKPLCDGGFVIPDSEPLAGRYQDACPEREGEAEGETEEEANASLPAGDEPPADDEPTPVPTTPDCPHGDIVALYHKHLPANPRIKVWDGARQEALRTRWREDPKRQSLAYWDRFLRHVAASPFLTGKVEGVNGRPFLPGLEWLVKAGNFAKIIEGRYHDRQHA